MSGNDIDWEAHARYLWDVLDEIDTASDIAKGDDAWYRRRVGHLQKKRFNSGGCPDGQEVDWRARPTSDGEDGEG